MKIGINTYLATDNFGEGVLIGASEIEATEQQIIEMFGHALKYHDVKKILESEPCSENEVVFKRFGAVTVKIFKLS